MTDIHIRVAGRAGRITLKRPHALNALSYDMCMAIDAALQLWQRDETVKLVILDAEGDKAFCAGGDIAELYQTGTQGDVDYGRRFWRDEYRMNARLFAYPKPVVSFLQGFTMGGGVGIGCHGTHRIVDESSRISMPEVGIGLVPDVGGSFLLARAPGHLGCYLGLTAARMEAGDAIHAGFADHYIPRDQWVGLIQTLETGGNVADILRAACPAPTGQLAPHLTEIDHLFAGDTLGGILKNLQQAPGEFAAKTLKSISRNAPLSMACTLEMIRRLRAPDTDFRTALAQEYRFTYRSMADSDFLEGTRAAIIDKDRSPKWQYADMDVPATAVSTLLAPLGKDELTFVQENAL